MHLGPDMAKELKHFRVTVVNRRKKVERQDALHSFQAHYKDMLSKVKSGGDPMKEEDWFDREMWLAKNGSLVYYSKREERELVHFTAEDMGKAVARLVPEEASCKPFAFEVQLQAAEAVEFAPSIFAAASQESL